jgi:putative hydrolase of the HAD superfamily
MIKAVIFDYGNVISQASNTRTLQDIADAYGVPKDEVGKYIGTHIGDFRKGKMTEDEFWENLSFDLGKPVPQNKYDLWRNDFRKKLEVSEEMLAFVRYLKSRGIRVAVVSNNIAPYVEVIKKQNGYKDFDVVINSCEVGCSKPDEEIYRLALNKLNMQSRQVLFVDDKQENVDTATKLGMETVLVTDTAKLEQDIRKVLDRTND